MTAKEKVLKVWPDAYCEEPRYGRGYSIWRGKESEDWFYGLGGGDSEEAAWQNAAESLPAQVEKADCACGQAAGSQHYTYHSAESCGVEPVESLPVEAKEKIDLSYKALGYERDIDGELIEPKPTPSTPADPTNTHGLFIKWDDDDRIFVAHIPEMDWITGHGDTREAAISMVEDNYREALNNLIRKPQPDSSLIPEQTPYPLLSNEWLEKFAPGTTMPGRVQSAHMAQELQQWRKWAAAKTIPEQTFEEWYDKARPLPDMSDGEFGQLVWNAAKGVK